MFFMFFLILNSIHDCIFQIKNLGNFFFMQGVAPFKEHERPSQQPQPLLNTNQNEERKRKVNRFLSSSGEKEINKCLELNRISESDKENESHSTIDYSAIDEGSNDGELLREAEGIGL